jgi:hypothetical protein
MEAEIDVRHANMIADVVIGITSTPFESLALLSAAMIIIDQLAAKQAGEAEERQRLIATVVKMLEKATVDLLEETVGNA